MDAVSGAPRYTSKCRAMRSGPSRNGSSPYSMAYLTPFAPRDTCMSTLSPRTAPVLSLSRCHPRGSIRHSLLHITHSHHGHLHITINAADRATGQLVAPHTTHKLTLYQHATTRLVVRRAYNRIGALGLSAFLQSVARSLDFVHARQ